MKDRPYPVRWDAVRWYPHRERLRSINPNGIGPYAWDHNGAGDAWGMVYVPIWHPLSAGYFIHRFRLLAGYKGETKS